MKEKKAVVKPFPLAVRIICFLAVFPYMETCLRLTNYAQEFSVLGFVRIILAGLCIGALLLFLCEIIPKKGIGRILTAVFLFSFAVFCMEEVCCRYQFETYFQIAFMMQMTGNVVGNFLGDTLRVIFHESWFLVLEFAPGILFIIFRKKLVPALGSYSGEYDWIPSEETGKGKDPSGIKRRFFGKGRLVFNCEQKKKRKLYTCIFLLLFLVLSLAAIGVCHVGGDNRFYTYNYNANDAIPRFGLINSIRLELEYAVFGAPVEEFEIIVETEPETEKPLPKESESETEEEVIVYAPNEMDIDFDSLIASDTSDIYTLMDTYFANQKSTLQNEYTGIFEGKNLIFLTAEAFSWINIDEERTPALYRLTQTGFVFNNYYQPDFGQSTTGGEFANMTGLIPMWVGSYTAFHASIEDYMPFGLGTIFNNLGYNVTAYHNGSYTYYRRNETHPNLGYEFFGIGGGLDIPSKNSFPESDLEMFEATVPEKIEAYIEDGTPFHLYYMTVSGHGRYSWSNAMSYKNREVTDGLTGYTVIDSYLAANMELEYALEYLLDVLEEAGILEDTVIVMGADHYPYYMTEAQDDDYFAIAAGFDGSENYMERYRNSLILWSGCLEDTTIIDTPCSSIDIVPTLFNLFGIEYDSRLFSGRDIFAEDVEVGTVASNMHVVCFIESTYGCSWITAAGQYDGTSGEFRPNEGVELDNQEEYIEKMCELVSQRCTMAKYILQYNYYAHVFS